MSQETTTAVVVKRPAPALEPGPRELSRNRQPARKRQRPFASTATYVVLVMVALVFLVPLLWVLVRSLQPGPLAVAPPTAQDFLDLTLANYRLIFSGNVDMGRYAINSLIVTAGTIALTICLASFAGLGFARYRFHGQGTVFLLILSAVMVPFATILTPLYLELHDFHLLNGLVGLILVYATFNLPFAVFIMRNTFLHVPREVVESAVVDGAGSFRLLGRIMLPLGVPGVLTVCIFTFLFSWTEFLAALTFITTQSRFTLPVALVNLEQGSLATVPSAVNFALLEAGSVVAAIPAVVIFIALQRYYVAGFSAGAVKG